MSKHDQHDRPEGVRLDRWLWAARFFKTRTLAAEAIIGGKVHVNRARVKPARTLHVGDELNIRRGTYEWTVLVRALAVERRPAPEASELYEETTQSQETRARLRAELHARAASSGHSGGRPSKKGRREIRDLVRGDRRTPG